MQPAQPAREKISYEEFRRRVPFASAAFLSVETLG
jgi:hypothetical protein